MFDIGDCSWPFTPLCWIRFSVAMIVAVSLTILAVVLLRWARRTRRGR